MKNRYGPWFALIVFLVVTTLGYVNYFITPGVIDFYLRWEQYQRFADETLLPEFQNIYGIQDNSIFFLDRTSCAFEPTIFDDPMCSEEYKKLLNMIPKDFIRTVTPNVGKQTVKMEYRSLRYFTSTTVYYYIYGKNWFTQAEKENRAVKQIINDHWIVTTGDISTPAWK